MPLEKQNKRKTEKRGKKNTQREGERGRERGGRERKRDRNDRLDSEEEEMKRCSRLLERYLCKTSGEKMIDIQNCILWQQQDGCHCSCVCGCLPPQGTLIQRLLEVFFFIKSDSKLLVESETLQRL